LLPLPEGDRAYCHRISVLCRIADRLIRFIASSGRFKTLLAREAKNRLRLLTNRSKLPVDQVTRSLTEIVGNDGRVFISGKGPAKLDAKEVSVVAQGGNAKLVTLEAHELKSIW